MNAYKRKFIFNAILIFIAIFGIILMPHVIIYYSLGLISIYLVATICTVLLIGGIAGLLNNNEDKIIGANK